MGVDDAAQADADRHGVRGGARRELGDPGGERRRDGDRIAVQVETEGDGQRDVDTVDAETRREAHGREQLRSVEGTDGELVADVGPGGLARERHVDALVAEEAALARDHEGRAIRQRDEAQPDARWRDARGRSGAHRDRSRSRICFLLFVVSHCVVTPRLATLRFDSPAKASEQVGHLDEPSRDLCDPDAPIHRGLAQQLIGLGLRE